MAHLRWTPHPVKVTIGDNRDYIRVLMYSYYTAITGWGVLLRHTVEKDQSQSYLLWGFQELEVFFGEFL